jgi:hypothetical protein
MSFRFVSVWGVGVLLTLGFNGGICRAQVSASRPRGRVIQFSEPKSKAAVTNQDQTIGKKDGLRQLEDELNRSLRSFSPQGSLDGAAAPQPYRSPVGPVIQTRRTKDLLERRKNWAFANPDDWLPGTLEGNLDNQSKYGGENEAKAASSADPLHGNSTRQRASGSSPGSARDDDRAGSGKGPGAREESEPDDSKLPSGIRENTQNLRKYINSADGGSLSGFTPVHSSFADFFGLGDKSLSPAQEEAHKNYMNQYRQVLDGTPATATLNDLTARDPARSGARYGGLEALPGSLQRPGFGATPAALDSFLHPTALPDVNRALLNQWNPMYTPPTLPPSRSAPLSVPLAEVPRRKF